MRNKKNLIGLLVLMLVGLALIRANGSETFYRMEKAAMMDAQSDKATAGQKKPEKQPVFACNMLALDAEQRRRHVAVTGQLRAATKELRPLSDGYEFRFTSEQSTILLASEFIARERLCCPFFTFELVVEPEDGPLRLRLRGADGVKDFIKAEFGIK